MPQGQKFKTKVKLPAAVKQKQKHQKKALGPKKGGRSIAPKKTRLLEATKLTKTLQKAINKNIEKEVSQKAHSNEAKPFHVLQSAGGDAASKK